MGLTSVRENKEKRIVIRGKRKVNAGTRKNEKKKRGEVSRKNCVCTKQGRPSAVCKNTRKKRNTRRG